MSNIKMFILNKEEMRRTATDIKALVQYDKLEEALTKTRKLEAALLQRITMLKHPY